MHSTKFVRACSSNTYIPLSYDPKLDHKLTEETTTLLESYTVRTLNKLPYGFVFELWYSSPMVELSKWKANDTKHPSAFSSHV